jgi:hypothetical protein
MWFFQRKRDKAFEKKDDIQAQDVRPKGVTRPSHQRADTPTAEMLRRARIDRTLQGFLSADNWEETHDTLVRDRELLLTDEAISVLRDFVQQVREQDQPNAQHMADYLDAHRILLERARIVGIEAAWREFRALRLNEDAEAGNTPDYDDETQAVIAVLKRLLGTESWHETYAILSEERERLTSVAAEQFLSALIQVARQDTNPQSREGLRYLELHRTLLRELRLLGLETAWANFEQGRRELDAEVAHRPAVGPPSEVAAVARALRRLLSTNNWADVRQILERDQALLLSEASDRILEDLLINARNDDDPRALKGVVYLGLHRRLIRRAREVGLSQAWSEFESALAEANGRATEILPNPFTGEINTLPELDPDSFLADDVPLEDVTKLVNAFLGAASWDQAHEVLIRHPQELMTEAAISLIEERAEFLYKRGDGRDVYAAHLLDLQATMLRRAREVGIERAWAEFEADRG